LDAKPFERFASTVLGADPSRAFALRAGCLGSVAEVEDAPAAGGEDGAMVI